MSDLDAYDAFAAEIAASLGRVPVPAVAEATLTRAATVGELRAWLGGKPADMPVWLRTYEIEAPLGVAEIDVVMTDFAGTAVKVAMLNADEGE